jgi:RNA polymerase sigma-70 factor (ECF subfamily)
MRNGTGKNKTNEREYYESVLSNLYEEYYDKIARYAYLRVGEKDEAEDIAGEVFLRALKSLKSYRERGIPMQAWLFRIAHNLVVDYFRKMPRYQTVPIYDVQIEGGVDPATEAERNAEVARVQTAMEQLTREQREVLRLRFFGELTSKETGKVMNKSDGAVREMQRAAIEKLRNILSMDKKP